MNQRQLFILSFFVLFILIFLQLIGVFGIFLQPILWAVVLALVLYPFYRTVRRLVGERKTVASLLVTLLAAVVVVAPMIFFSGALVRETLGFYQDAAHWLGAREYQTLWQRVLQSPLGLLWGRIQEQTSGLEINLAPVMVKMSEALSNAIVGQIKSGAANFIFFVLNFLVTFISLFFFLRDGEAMVQGLKDLFPMTRENKDAVFGRLEETVSAVVRAVLATSLAQSVLGGLSFWILGVPFPLFLALLTAFLALVPVGGAVLVWLPAAGWLAWTGHPAKGVILFLIGAVVISSVDNIIKPLVIGGRTKLPTLFLFFAIVGGLKFYGLIGVFLGPVMLGIFLTLIQIYRKEYPAS